MRSIGDPWVVFRCRIKEFTLNDVWSHFTSNHTLQSFLSINNYSYKPICYAPIQVPILFLAYL